MRLPMHLKTTLSGVAVVAVSFLIGLKAMDGLAPRGTVKPPVLAELPPLAPAPRSSIVMAPIAVALSAIRDAADRGSPRTFNGKAENPISQILQNAEGYKEQAVAEAKGQSARFTKVYDEYKKAPDVTRQRIYLETMEKILGGSEKLVYDSGNSGQSVVPYLPLGELTPRRTAPAAPQQQTGGTR